MSRRFSIPADPQARLIYAAKMIAADSVQMGMERKPSVHAGMVLALGRLFEAVTGQPMSTVGPRGVMQWAIQLDKPDGTRISS